MKLNSLNVPEKFLQKVVLRFDDIKSKCNFNYSIELTANNHAYFTSPGSPFSAASTRTILAYNLDVLSPVIPYFLYQLTGEQNHTIIVANGTNSTDILVVANSNTLVVESDSNIELRCENDGRPKPIVSWFKDKKMLNLTDQKYALMGGHSLKILRAHSTDSGIYECTIFNKYGSKSREFNVTVNQEKVFIKQMGKRHIFLIVVISIVSLISLILLVLVTVRLIKQKKENARLKVIYYIFFL